MFNFNRRKNYRVIEGEDATSSMEMRGSDGGATAMMPITTAMVGDEESGNVNLPPTTFGSTPPFHDLVPLKGLLSPVKSRGKGAMAGSQEGAEASGEVLRSSSPLEAHPNAEADLVENRGGAQRGGNPGEEEEEAEGEPTIGCVHGAMPPASHDVLRVSFSHPQGGHRLARQILSQQQPQQMKQQYHPGSGQSNASSQLHGRASRASSLASATAASNKSSHHSQAAGAMGRGGSGRNTPTILQPSSSANNRRWEHMGDVDAFFRLLYEYHQGNGWLCIALRHAFALFQFVFVVGFSTFLLQCVDYDVLFANKNVTATAGATTGLGGKRHIRDALIPHCYAHLPPLYVLTLLLAFLFWLVHFARAGYRLLQLLEIRHFYASALQIDDADLSSWTWAEVVERLCRLQPDIRLIISQERITPLDVYQRILRHKNYFVAMVHLGLLPPMLRLPFSSSPNGVPYLSNGLRLNMEWLLFWGPWAPWRGAYALKEECKDASGGNLEALAEKLRSAVAWAALANFLLSPAIFLYQILFSFFHYSDLLKREPGVFGTRKYSNYGKDKLRHFNELDHELTGRLNRSYEFAVRYMDQFISPLAEIVAKCVAFTCGSLFAVLAVLSAWDEDVLNVEHVLTAMTVCGAVVMICRSFIPDENLVLCQEFLMRHVLANLHYAPSPEWLANADSPEVCREFAQLFQLKAQFLGEELLSPLITPYVLYFHIRPRASDFVHFFHTYTRHVEGLGDVCSLAQMDIARDGDARLHTSTSQIAAAAAESQPTEHAVISSAPSGPFTASLGPHHQAPFGGLVATSDKTPLKGGDVFHYTSYDQHQHRNNGKIELSLLNFSTTNPTWEPPTSAAGDFIRSVREMGTADEIVESVHGGLPTGGGRQGIDEPPSSFPLTTTNAGKASHQLSHLTNAHRAQMEMSCNALALNRLLTAANADGCDDGSGQEGIELSESIAAGQHVSSQLGPLLTRGGQAMLARANLPTPPAPLESGEGFRFGAATGARGGYGSTAMYGMGGGGGGESSRYLPLHPSTTASIMMRTTASTNPNIAQSNIWGVPEMSVMLNEEVTASSFASHHGRMGLGMAPDEVPLPPVALDQEEERKGRMRRGR